MGRKMISVETLHGHSLRELVRIKNKCKDEYGNTMLSIIINRYEGMTTTELAKKYNKSKPTIIDYIRKWNTLGLSALVDSRGGSVGTFTDEMLQTIKYAMESESPIDYGFDSSTWNISMFASLIERKFGIHYSYEWIRKVIKSNNFIYKRSKYKPRYAELNNRVIFKNRFQVTRA